MGRRAEAEARAGLGWAPLGAARLAQEWNLCRHGGDISEAKSRKEMNREPPSRPLHSQVLIKAAFFCSCEKHRPSAIY